MKKFFQFFLGLFLLTACGSQTSQEFPLNVPTPVGTFFQPPTPTGEPSATPLPPVPEPFTRDAIYLEETELRTLPDQPGMIVLYVAGQLPTPCHQAASVVCPSCMVNAPNLIQVSLCALIETGKVCRGPTTPFEQEVPLGVFSEGVYVVQLNGQYVGEFDAARVGSVVEMRRGEVFIEGVSLLPPSENNGQARMLVQGVLPTPCHVFKAEVAPVNENGEIQIEAYSLVSAEGACVDVVQDFTTEIPLGALAAGNYSIWVNGEKVGALEVP